MVDSSRRSFVIGTGLTAASTAILPATACAGCEAILRSPASAANTAATPAGEQHVSRDPPVLQPSIDRERVDIRETLTKEGIPGAAVCLVHEGKPAWIEGFGVTDQKSRRPVSERTLFSIQSTSKNFTATAIMQSIILSDLSVHVGR